MTITRALLGATLLTVSLAACSGGNDGNASGSATSAPTSAATEAPTSATTPTGLSTSGASTGAATSETTHEVGTQDASLLKPRTDLKEEQPLEWTPAGTEDKAVYVTVITGNEKCQGVRVEKEETADSVRIATYLGTPPGAPDSCTREAMIGKIKVDLDQPLGDRKLVNGEGATVNPHATATR